MRLKVSRQCCMQVCAHCVTVERLQNYDYDYGYEYEFEHFIDMFMLEM